MGKLVIAVQRATGLPAAENGTSSPYVELGVGLAGKKVKTTVKKGTTNPTWRETFSLPVHTIPNERSQQICSDPLCITVYHSKQGGKDPCLGEGQIELNTLKQNTPIIGKVTLKDGGLVIVRLSAEDFGITDHALLAHPSPSPTQQTATLPPHGATGGGEATHHTPPQQKTKAQIVDDLTKRLLQPVPPSSSSTPNTPHNNTTPRKPTGSSQPPTDVLADIPQITTQDADEEDDGPPAQMPQHTQGSSEAAVIPKTHKPNKMSTPSKRRTQQQPPHNPSPSVSPSPPSPYQLGSAPTSGDELSVTSSPTPSVTTADDDDASLSGTSAVWRMTTLRSRIKVLKEEYAELLTAKQGTDKKYDDLVQQMTINGQRVDPTELLKRLDDERSKNADIQRQLTDTQDQIRFTERQLNERSMNASTANLHAEKALAAKETELAQQENKVLQKEHELQQLNAKVEKMSAELTSLQESGQSQNKGLAQAQQELSQKCGELAQLKQELNWKESQLKMAEDQLKITNEKTTEAAQMKGQFTASVARLQQQVQDKDVEIEQTKTQLQRAQERAQEATATLQKQQRELDMKLAQASATEADNKELLQMFQDVQHKLAVLEQRNDTLWDQLEEAKKEIDMKDQQLNKCERELNDLQSQKVLDTQSKIEAKELTDKLWHQLEGKDRDIDQMHQQFAAEREKDLLKHQLQLNELKQGLTSEVDMCNCEKQNMEKDVQDKIRLIDELKQQLVHYENRLHDTEAARIAETSQFEVLQRELGNANQQISEYEKIHKQLSEIWTATIAQKGQLDDAHMSLEHMMEYCVQILNEMQSYKQTAEQAQRDLDVERSKQSQLEAELARAITNNGQQEMEADLVRQDLVQLQNANNELERQQMDNEKHIQMLTNQLNHTLAIAEERDTEAKLVLEMVTALQAKNKEKEGKHQQEDGGGGDDNIDKDEMIRHLEDHIATLQTTIKEKDQRLLQMLAKPPPPPSGPIIPAHGGLQGGVTAMSEVDFLRTELRKTRELLNAKMADDSDHSTSHLMQKKVSFLETQLWQNEEEIQRKAEVIQILEKDKQKLQQQNEQLLSKVKKHQLTTQEIENMNRKLVNIHAANESLDVQLQVSKALNTQLQDQLDRTQRQMQTLHHQQQGGEGTTPTPPLSCSTTTLHNQTSEAAIIPKLDTVVSPISYEELLKLQQRVGHLEKEIEGRDTKDRDSILDTSSTLSTSVQPHLAGMDPQEMALEMLKFSSHVQQRSPPQTPGQEISPGSYATFHSPSPARSSSQPMPLNYALLSSPPMSSSASYLPTLGA